MNPFIRCFLLLCFFISAQSFCGVGQSDGIETGYFKQKLDHSKPESETFDQKFYLYSHPEATSDSPVFYMLGNENGISPGYLTGTVMKYLADTFKGHAVILEHRFYGESIPKLSLENSNLTYLTTEQALSDFATFQKSFTLGRGFTGKWISIGSSYAGNLSAYYRLKYPDLVEGAIVSSAPLYTPQFNRVMDEQVAKELGPECLKSYQERIADIKANLMNPEYRQVFNQKTGSEKIVDDRSIYFAIADLMTTIVQRGAAEKACSVLKTKPGLEGLVASLEVITGPSLNLYENSLEFALPSTTTITSNTPGYRQWYYQACTEYGFWQIPNEDETSRFRDSSVDENYYEWFCQKAYGIKLVEKRLSPLDHYLSKIETETALNLLLINGQRDPWARLSWKDSFPERGLNVYNQVKGYHGTGIGGPRSNEAPDSPALIARKMMVSFSEKWMAP